MRFQTLLLGVVLCLGAAAQGQPGSLTAKSAQKPDAVAAVSVNGCVDQQDTRYVLRDLQTSQLVTLRSSSRSADEDFAKFVGHHAQASGTMSNGALIVMHIAQVADMCPVGK